MHLVFPYAYLILTGWLVNGLINAIGFMAVFYFALMDDYRYALAIYLATVIHSISISFINRLNDTNERIKHIEEMLENIEDKQKSIENSQRSTEWQQNSNHR